MGKALPPPSGPLKVLLFTSLPDDLHPEKGRLDVETEQANVLEAFDPYIKDGWVHLEAPDDGTFATFQSLLQTGTFHLVFLSGHGVGIIPAFQYSILCSHAPLTLPLSLSAPGVRCSRIPSLSGGTVPYSSLFCLSPRGLAPAPRRRRAA